MNTQSESTGRQENQDRGQGLAPRALLSKSLVEASGFHSIMRHSAKKPCAVVLTITQRQGLGAAHHKQVDGTD